MLVSKIGNIFVIRKIFILFEEKLIFLNKVIWRSIFFYKIFDKENGVDFNMWLFNCCMKIMLFFKY